MSKKKYLNWIFIKSSCYILILVVIMFLVFYFYSVSFLSKTVYNSSLDSFSVLGSFYDHINENVKISSLTILYNESVSELLTQLNPLHIQIEKAFNQIEYHTHLNPLIHSIYLYNGNNKTYYIYNKNRSVRERQFYDTNIITHIENLSNGPQIPIIRRMPESEKSETEIDVLSYILKLDFKNDLFSSSFMVVNVPLLSIIENLPTKEDAVALLMILDYNGNFLSSENLNEKSQNKIFEKITSQGKKSGYFILKIDGEKTLYSYQFLSSPNIITLQANSYKSISSYMLIFKITLVLLLLLEILILTHMIFNISKHKYIPIDNIFNRVLSLDTSKKTVPMINDFVHVLEKHVENLSEEMRSLLCFKRVNNAMSRNAELKRFLFKSDSISSLEKFNFFSDNGKYLVISFCIDNYSNFQKDYNYFDQNLNKYALINIALEMTGEFFPCDYIDLDSDCITAIINIIEKNNHLEILTKVISDIQQAYLDYFNISISAFISEPYDDITFTTSSYKFCKNLSTHKIYFGHRCILTPQKYKTLQLKDEMLTFDDIKLISNLINLSKANEAIEFLKKTMDTIRNFNYYNLKVSINLIATSVFKAYYLNNQKSGESYSVSYNDFFSEINNLETIDEIQAMLEKSITVACCSKNDKKIQNTVLYIEDFINQNYHNSNLCTKTIADEIGLSTRYTAKLYYDSTGEKIQNYINNIRIKKATELLKNTNIKINKIADAIGWSNLKYFYTYFKRETGYTPSEYRSEHGTFSGQTTDKQ